MCANIIHHFNAAGHYQTGVPHSVKNIEMMWSGHIELHELEIPHKFHSWASAPGGITKSCIFCIAYFNLECSGFLLRKHRISNKNPEPNMPYNLYRILLSHPVLTVMLENIHLNSCISFWNVEGSHQTNLYF